MKISVITVCFNAEQYIERAIKSVLAQSYGDIEYIVVDGASQDSTLSILKRYSDQINRLISEEDNGIYDAMNKGIHAATGDLLFFLNSDDFFVHPDALKMALDAIGEQEADIYYGDLLILGSSGKVECEEHTNVDKFGIFFNFPSMPSLLYTRAIFEKVGLFSTDYRIVSDYLWIVTAYVEYNVKALYLNLALAVFQIGGISANAQVSSLQKQEKYQVRALFFSDRNWMLYKKIVKRRHKLAFVGRALERIGTAVIALKRGAFK